MPRAGFALVLLVVVCALCVAPVRAQPFSPEITRGLTWLQGQVQANGGLANEAASIATPLQNRAEAAHALALLASVPGALTSAVETELDDNTEYLARRIITLARAGQPIASLAAVLTMRQNQDGGFGGGPGFDSNPLDTAWALLSLKAANVDGPAPPAIGYLTSVQAADGAYSVAGRPDAETTAMALLGLRAYASRFQVTATLQRAVGYLLAQRSATQQWGDAVFLTATVYEAIHDFVPPEPTASAVKTFLSARQAADGGWEGDPFATALALRALLLSGVAPANPTLAIIKGRVLDGQTGLPLQGVRAALAGPASVTFTTGANGVFEFRDLSPGAYTVQLSLTEYGAINTTTNLQAGQTLDLGTLAMAKIQTATTGTVRGTVKDAGTGQGLEGARVALAGGASVLTDAAGNYQVPNVAPGPISVQASKAGYANAGGSASLAAGDVLVFSPALVRTEQPPAGASVAGTVTRASDGAPLAGVLITLSGANMAGATTDALGRYSIGNLNLGPTQLRASLAGFDTVNASAIVVENATVNFSPRLFATATTPPDENKSAVTGVVLDSGTSAPLAGVTVVATIPGSATQSLQTGADGRFSFTGISTATAALRFTLSSYLEGLVDVAIEPLATLDMGQVRLRRGDADQLLPDLAVLAVSRAGATTHPQALTVSGSVSATIGNLGTAPSAAGLEALAFLDVNRNGAFDPAVDTVLGRATLSAPVEAGASTVLEVPVQGRLPFRDAPIHVWVDSAQAAAELKEDNNVGSSAKAVEIKPTVGQLQPQLKWHWQSSPNFPSHVQVESGILVVQTTDDNGDGKIDADDIPDVAFVAYSLSDFEGVLRIVDGRTGAEIRSVRAPGGVQLSGWPGFAAADIDGDGVIEFLIPTLSGQLAAVSHTGALKWVTNISPAPNTGQPYGGGPSIVDLDGDGAPEIVWGRYALRNDGSLLWRGAGSFQGAKIGMHSIAADIDLDGKPEVIVGASAYNAQGALLWQNSTAGDGYAAVGNFNSDPYPEIVVVTEGRISMLNRFGALIWGPVLLPGGGRGGAPTIADMDGDGVPEIGVAGATRYSVFRADGSVKWSAPVQDASSSQTGSSVFDFDGDGRAEVVYADEVNLYIFDGHTGAKLFTLPHSSGTAGEQPVVADIDGDGRADLLVAEDRFFNPGGFVGIRAYQGTGNSWVSARPLWNQYAYHVTNVNDDGTIPAVEENSWQAHNTYRANIGRRLFACLPPQGGALGSPVDVSASYLRIQDGGLNPSTFTVRVGNSGALRLKAGVRTAFYNGAPGAGGVLLGAVTTTRALGSGEFEDVSLVFTGALAGLGELFARVDDDARLAECDEANNAVSYPLAALPGVFTIQVATDRPSYGPHTNVAITAPIANNGSLDRPATVRFTIETADGMGEVAVLSPLVTLTVPRGASASASATWNTAATLTGAYRVKAELLDSAAQPIAAAFAPFSILTGIDVAAAAKVVTDKQTYLPSETVQATSRASNLTLNQPLDNLTAVTTVLNPDGSVRFTRSELIPQLAQGAGRDFVYAVPLSFAGAGTYGVTLSLRAAGGAQIAASSTSFTVASTAATGSGLTGTLIAVPKQVPLGDAAVLSFSARNQGNGALAALPLTVRIVDPQTERVLAEFSETANIAAGATHLAARSWATQGTAGATYVAVLSATVGTTTLTLAQDSFTLIAPPVQLDVALTNLKQARVLVLLSCKYGHDEKEQGSAQQQACIDERRSFLGAYFTGLGITHRITTTEPEFRLAFRSGLYNTYWVTGGGMKLMNTLSEEVREAVFRGDALIRDGVHDERHFYFDAEAGVTLIGKLDPMDQAVSVNGTLFTPGTLPSVGRPLKLGVTTGQVQAVFPVSANSPAIVANQYGLGRGVLFGYDLIGTAMAHPSSALDQVVLAALGWIAPTPASPAASRSYTVVRGRIANVGLGTGLKATFTPPAGAAVLSTMPAATPDASGRPVWTFTLDSGATQDLAVGLRLPETAGNYTATLGIDAIRNGIATPYGSFDLTLGVETSEAIAPRVATELAALSIPLPSDRTDRDIAVSSIQAAQSALAAGDYEAAIGQLITAAERLLKITSVNIAPQRVDAARILQEAQIRWALTQP